MKSPAFRTFLVSLGMAALLTAVAYAQEANLGKLKINVTPGESYLFVDGNGMAPGSRTVDLSVGAHKILVANYGYRFWAREVTINPGETTPLDVSLEREGDVVFGPKGRIQIEVGHLDAGDAAVLLNGKSPSYFVGHVDEFNNELFLHQELIVPPGNHLVTITRHGTEIWSGKLSVPENQRVIVDISNGRIRTKDWSRGKHLDSLHRFKAGIASATVVIAPVSSSISAYPSKIDCGQRSEVKWTSAETIDADISGMSPVPVAGQRSVSPKESTTYELTATGPGGVTKSSSTVEVNPVVQSSLTVSPAEARYRRIGDKVKEAGNISLNWSATNADTVSLAPLGTVDTSGSRSLVVTPSQTSNGPVDEVVKYALSASNACGGTETKTAAVHITGSIEPIPEMLLHSVFYPTDYPSTQKPSLGLVRSQQEALTALAAGFTKYLEYDPDAKLTLAGYADERNTNKYNQFLSERRVQRVREFLISQGVAENKIETEAYGEERPIDMATVTDLQAKNPNQPSESRVRNFRATWLAYNRRVDVLLLPTNRESLQFYPNNANDSDVLWQKARLSDAVIEQNQ
ncbi:MAG: OmpA family protein [Acidobacteriia bacterium]|nr:OmpA family protein [Terriglobia bacterium]